MGYRIEYDGRIGKYEVKKDYTGRSSVLTVGALILFFVYTYLFWPEGSAELRSLMIPGADAVTVQAFHNMTSDLRSGASVSEAVYGFCRYVIHAG